MVQSQNPRMKKNRLVRIKSRLTRNRLHRTQLLVLNQERMLPLVVIAPNHALL